MITKRRILIGGLGALMPIILNLLIIDFTTIGVDFTILKFIGYLIKIIVLFGLGALIAYFHKKENDAFKIFQLGLGAPALIVGMLNGSNIQPPITDERASGNNDQSSFNILGSTAYAATVDMNMLKRFKPPKQSPVQQFWQGLTGTMPKNVWFVIVGSHLDSVDAQQQADSINIKEKDFTAEVYEPYGGNPYYAVVIGAYLTLKQAQVLRRQAINTGMPKDTYLWTFPRE